MPRWGNNFLQHLAYHIPCQTSTFLFKNSLEKRNWTSLHENVFQLFQINICETFWQQSECGFELFKTQFSE